MSLIVFDTETTGLTAPGAAALEHQPYLVELVAIKLNDALQEIDNLSLRCKPPIDIPDEATKIHGITNEMVAHLQPFAFFYPLLSQFFLGAEYVIGHNVMFDKLVLYYELVRLGKQLQFPWPPGAICTADHSLQQHGFRMNLQDLHIHLFEESFVGAHSAMADCRVTMKCFVAMVDQGVIVL